MDLRDLHKRYVRRRFHPECRLEGFPAQEIEVIERYGSWLEALMKETIQPFTEDQKRFIAMCKGERKAESMFEVIWRKYRLEVLYNEDYNEALRMEQLISDTWTR
jgi:uncharacterized protein YifE (UPF0438 family)